MRHHGPLKPNRHHLHELVVAVHAEFRLLGHQHLQDTARPDGVKAELAASSDAKANANANAMRPVTRLAVVLK